MKRSVGDSGFDRGQPGHQALVYGLCVLPERGKDNNCACCGTATGSSYPKGAESGRDPPGAGKVQTSRGRGSEVLAVSRNRVSCRVRELFAAHSSLRWPAVRFVTRRLRRLLHLPLLSGRSLRTTPCSWYTWILLPSIALSAWSFFFVFHGPSLSILPLCALASRTVRTDVLVLWVGKETSITSAWWRDLCLSVCLQGSRLRTRHTSSRTRDLLSGLSSWCFLSCPDGLSTLGLKQST